MKESSIPTFRYDDAPPLRHLPHPEQMPKRGDTYAYAWSRAHSEELVMQEW